MDVSLHTAWALAGAHILVHEYMHIANHGPLLYQLALDILPIEAFAAACETVLFKQRDILYTPYDTLNSHWRSYSFECRNSRSIGSNASGF